MAKQQQVEKTEELTKKNEKSGGDIWDMAAQKAWDAVLAKSRQLSREGKTLEEIAAFVGASNRSTIAGWLSGNRGGPRVAFPDMLRYMHTLGLNLVDFLPQKEFQVHQVGSFHALPAKQGYSEQEVTARGMSVLPVHARAGAGPAWNFAEADPLFYVGVPEFFMRQAPKAVQVRGNSMEPTIRDQAVVGISPDAPEIIQGKIYAIHLPYEGLVVKRVYLDHANKEFVFKSDNKEHPDIHVPFADADGIIQGRVMWVLQQA